MTTATAPLRPLEDWDHEAWAAFTTKAMGAGSVAFQVLVHDQGLGRDIATLVGPVDNRRPLPKGMESEDLFDFVFTLINDAAEIGYVTAKLEGLETVSFERPWEGARLRVSDVARTVAALLRTELVEDDEAFDPDYAAKIEAASKAYRDAAAAA